MASLSYHRNYHRLRVLVLVVSAASLALSSSSALAGAADEGISVLGIATVKGHPSEVEISGTVSGEGELANDASVKFHDGRKKAIAAIDNLKNPDLSVESKGSDVHETIDAAQQQRMMQGMAAEPLKSRIQISEKLTLKLKNIDKMEPDKVLSAVLKLIDTARDAGISTGQSGPMNYYQMQMQMQNGGADDSLVQFKIPDTTLLQDEAYKQAIADARAKADRIAQMSGIKLGRIIYVHDEGGVQTVHRSGYNNGNNNETSIEKEVKSPTFGEISLKVKVQVQFEIEK